MVVEFIAPIGAAILAGIGWSTLGIWSKWRSGASVDIEWDKVKKNVIIGAGIGVATYVYELVNGNPEPLINSAGDFAVALGGYFPVIVLVDKLINRTAQEQESD